MPRPCAADHDPSPASCRVCALAAEPTARGASYRRAWAEQALAGDDALPRAWTPAAAAPPRDAPCRHLGLPLRQAACAGCGGGTSAAVHACALHGECVPQAGKSVKGVRQCRFCADHSPAEASGHDAGAALPQSGTLVARFDEHNLGVGLPGKRFNSSLIEDPTTPGGYLLAHRDGWAGSEIWLSRLDGRLRPQGRPWRLGLHHPLEANYGREDSRLFMHAGRVHVMYVGVVGGHSILHTSVLYARLSEDCSRVEQIWYPHYPHRNSYEKNWSFFSSGGRLYAVYSVAPHRILEIDGHRAEMAHETPTPAPWCTGKPHGEVRGGASPVLVGDEFFSFFHDRLEGPRRVYRMGLYTFDAAPPFRVRRIIPGPILSADPATNPDNYADVVFPCGAARDPAGDWLVSMGVHDRFTEIHRFGHADLETRLVEVSPPPWWRWRGEPYERGTFASVCAHDEYRTREHGLAGLAVLDVGAHVGSFARLCVLSGAAVVHCYEPSPDTFDMLAYNAARMGPAVSVFCEAVGADGTASVVPGDQETTSDSVAFGTGGVPAVTLDAAITRLCAVSPSGRVGLLKLDCEGAEWPALAQAASLDLVDRIAGEYHMPMTGGVGAKSAGPLAASAGVTPSAAWLRDRLRDAGFAYLDVLEVKSGHGSALFFARRAAE